MKKVRKHICFSGTVQGVGFRYRARYAAGSLGLTGWVKNLWDGRVEMEVQGTEEEIAIMLENLNQSHFIQIDHMETETMPTETAEVSFQVIG